MKIAVVIIAVVLGALGLLFLVAAGQGNAVVRIGIGVVCLAAAAALVALVRLKPVRHVHEMKLDAPGELSLKQSTCQQCSATLSSQSVRIAAGTVFVHCEYCGAEYQIEEETKW